MKKYLTLLIAFCYAVVLNAQQWTVEAEDAQSYVKWDAKGVADIYAPKGLTLWCNDLMEGNTVIEYEAMIMADKTLRDETKPCRILQTDKGGAKKGKSAKHDEALRISDLNCFWMADRMNSCGARFVNNYALSMYYVGYGGNYNTTTRFRRYNGDARGVDSAQYRPGILKEYTDPAHLLVPDKWYSIRLEQIDGKVRYYVDGELLVDYLDLKPLVRGYFGFRTTFAHARLRNFRYRCDNPDERPIVLRNVAGNGTTTSSSGTVFGVPFAKGEQALPANRMEQERPFTITTDKGIALPFDTWRLASWNDGSAKWQAFAVVVPEGTDSLLLTRQPSMAVNGNRMARHFAQLPSFQVTLNGKVQPVLTSAVEQQGNVLRVEKYTGRNFIIRAYIYSNSDVIKLTHTLLVDSVLNKEGLHELALKFRVPMHGKAYERFVRFDDRSMSVQPLVARRRIDLERMDSVTRSMLRNIAQWDEFRLSQLSPNGYSIRKRATSLSPWIGTMEGNRSRGEVTVGDSTASMTFMLKDFWQSYPSTLLVTNARQDTATVSICLYSPEAEPYSFEHYDTIAHTLEAAYEDVQPGLSTAWGIGRTSEIFIHAGSAPVCETAFVPTPEYLHRKHAFGIWSLPTMETGRDTLIENTLTHIMDFYDREIERHGWYGYFNYGDVMHAYDEVRDEWRYDVGGFAWDNTELGTPAMLWYQFLRTGSPLVWRMATAMTRHCSEVDTYHFGPHAGLGSRHNVVHWGCGAKESRVSEAWWNRFMYYLTGDRRLGDIMDEVVQSDTLLYTLDPMRLAEPRSLYPCTAPARLRLGPDWLGYASNWFTDWERRADHRSGTLSERKLFAGINSISGLREGFFTGPKALGYDPATGIITCEADSTVRNTNHLLAIMGGFEFMNELEQYISSPRFFQVWLDHARKYKPYALKISRNNFRVPRLAAYAGWRLGDDRLKQDAWDDLLNNIPLRRRTQIWTNDCATWTLDAIFMKEVTGK